MAKAEETMLVVPCCANEVLCAQLPVMYSELEKCQKSLEGYLEQKRNKFPRFYFVSNPVLLEILSKGSDPLQIQPYYETMFDSIGEVVHDSKDKFIIREFICRFKGSQERLTFSREVVAKVIIVVIHPPLCTHIDTHACMSVINDVY